jgi:hypothetical protein
MSHSVLLRTRNVADKICKKIKTQILWSKTFFENRAAYEMWKTLYSRTCWIPKATNTHSQYAVLITFPLQQRLHERTSTLRYTYVASPVINYFMPKFTDPAATVNYRQYPPKLTILGTIAMLLYILYIIIATKLGYFSNTNYCS